MSACVTSFTPFCARMLSLFTFPMRDVLTLDWYLNSGCMRASAPARSHPEVHYSVPYCIPCFVRCHCAVKPTTHVAGAPAMSRHCAQGRGDGAQPLLQEGSLPSRTAACSGRGWLLSNSTMYWFSLSLWNYFLFLSVNQVSSSNTVVIYNCCFVWTGIVRILCSWFRNNLAAEAHGKPSLPNPSFWICHQPHCCYWLADSLASRPCRHELLNPLRFKCSPPQERACASPSPHFLSSYLPSSSSPTSPQKNKNEG